MATDDRQGHEGPTELIQASEIGPVLRVPRARLSVTNGPDQGRTEDIKHHRVVVGSAAECDFTLTDPASSRRHFELVRTDEGFLLRDLGSTNGTFVRGLRVKSAVLGLSEEIKVGHTTLSFVVQDKHDAFPLSTRSSFGSLLGGSKVMRQVFAVLERAARTDATILLEGESGTGKDLAAENLHRHSSRAEHPFIVVDCGAVTPSLVGSELFGHRRGAFTGADQDREGAFRAAMGGTVFLDEIGTLDLSFQPQLLRLLERREVKRLGEDHYRQVDVRIIAATNRDLEQDVREGRFREDLFYRLSVVRVYLPPLRDRREDLRLIASAFVESLGGGLKPEEVINDDLLQVFYNHDWPGNVRELRNVIERLIILPGFPASGMSRSAARDEAWLGSDAVGTTPYRTWKDQVERAYLARLLELAGGAVAEASQISDIPKPTLYRMLKKHGLWKR